MRTQPPAGGQVTAERVADRSGGVATTMIGGSVPPYHTGPVGTVAAGTSGFAAGRLWAARSAAVAMSPAIAMPRLMTAAIESAMPRILPPSVKATYDGVVTCSDAGTLQIVALELSETRQEPARRPPVGATLALLP